MNKYNKYSLIANNHLIDFFKSKNKKESFNLLEIGCNAGQNLKALYELYPKATYDGIDILPDAIDQAKENFPEGRYFVFNIEEPPSFFNENKYDYILCPDVLEHLTFPKEVLKYLTSLLKPDGYIIANIPNLMHWTVMTSLLLLGRFSYTEIGLLDYDHKHLFTYYEIIKIFEEANLSIDYMTYIKLGNVPKDFKYLFDYLIDISDSRIDISNYEAFAYMVMAHKIDN